MLEGTMDRAAARPGKEPASDRAVADIAVVIVCLNNRKYLEPCLESLFNADMRSRFEVVAVDNGSTDGSQAFIKERFPSVKTIQNSRNEGLGRASNQGIAATRGRYILLLNDDTLVNGPSLGAMVEFMDAHPDAAAVGGQLLNPDGTVQSCYNRFPTLVEEFLIATRLGDLIWPGYPATMEDPDVRRVDWMGSACLMLRRSALSSVGVLDEEYFIYGDEADLQYRLKQAGWHAYYLPQATTVHFGGRSMNRWGRRRMVYRGHVLFFKKHYGPLRTGVLRALLSALSLLKMVVWAPALALPTWRERAQRELRSNIDVVKLCWQPE